MKRLTTWRSAKRAAIANNDGATPLQQTMKIPGVIDRLAAIEDILGDEYDLDRLRELLEADRDGRCVVYLKGFPVASTYLQESGLYIRETSGVIGHEEYRAALKGVQDGGVH